MRHLMHSHRATHFNTNNYKFSQIDNFFATITELPRISQGRKITDFYKNIMLLK
jgi:hypothetical protein